MRQYWVTVEHDHWGVFEGVATTDKIEIGHELRIRLMTKPAEYVTGVVIMYQEVDNSGHGVDY